MAYLARRPSGAVQIRESVRTPDGPRSRTLATFNGTLDESVLDQADRRATRPIDRAGLIERARAMGIDWQSSAARAARRLVHGLRQGAAIQPAVKRLLLSELGGVEPAPLERSEFEEAAEWIGASPEERAASLRGLLRLGDAIVQSRDSLRVLPSASFPAFSSAGSRRTSDPGRPPGPDGDPEPGAQSRGPEVSG